MEQNKIEQNATFINPRMIVSWTKPDHLFNQVRSQKMEEVIELKKKQKLVELAAYKEKPAEGKLKDI
jgi:hypothetical protein